MGIKEVTKTARTRLCIESGERSWLKDARYTARDIANDTLNLKQQGYNRTEIQKEVDREDFLRNNKCAVVGKALQAWDSYKELLNWWHDQDDTHVGKPSPPATDKKGAYPLVMAHTEGYRLSYNDETDRVQFRVSPKPYKKVKGHLRGRPENLNLIKSALTEDEWSLGQAELLYREIENVGGNVLVILDEIDNIPPDARNDFLYELPRAEANENTPIIEAKIGLIGISNDLKFVDVLEPKVKSTLGEREIKFGPYNANELNDILDYYADMAFKDGVLDDDVIPLAAAFSAQERGDVRQGKRILQKAGELARIDDVDVVTSDHTREATETVETDEILDYFEQDLTSHQAMTYLATALAVIEPQQEATTKRIYKLYSSVAESVVSRVKSERKIYEFLDQLSMQGLVRSAEENLGREGGRRYVYDITDNPRDIIAAARKSSYSDAVPSNIDEMLTYHLEEEASEYEAPDMTDPQQENLWNFT